MYSDEKTIANDQPIKIEAWVEPWASAIEIAPGKSCVFFSDSEIKGELEIVQAGETLELYGWEGSNLIARIDGQIVFDMSEIRCPIVGISPKDFVQMVFREQPKKWWKIW